MTALHRNRGHLLVILLGVLIGTLGAGLRSAGISPTDCLVFSAVFGCLLGAVWQRPGPGLAGSLAAFGLWGYVVPYVIQLT
jgi:hypothetical protein